MHCRLCRVRTPTTKAARAANDQHVLIRGPQVPGKRRCRYPVHEQITIHTQHKTGPSPILPCLYEPNHRRPRKTASLDWTLKPPYIAEELRRLGIASGIDPTWNSSHSLRIGGRRRPERPRDTRCQRLEVQLLPHLREKEHYPVRKSPQSTCHELQSVGKLSFN